MPRVVIFVGMILVTGGAGFIGSNLVARLVENGEDVVVCDRFDDPDKVRNLSKHTVRELVDPDDLGRFLKGNGDAVARIIHLGAISSTTEVDPFLLTETNVRLSQRLWLWCGAHDLPFIYASSAATYGDGTRGFDDTETPLELARFEPLNAYGWSKHVFDRWVARSVEVGGSRPPQWVGLKFFNVYGPNEYHKGPMRSGVTRAYAAAASGKPVTLFRSHHPDYPDGGQKRDFVYVEDCVDAMIWLGDHPEVSGLFNLGTGRAQTWLELMGALYAAVGQELEVRWVDTPEGIRSRYQYFTQANMAKLVGAGYERRFRTVEEGVRTFVNDFLATEDPYR